MKLSQIKLAGFKSFVDPTTININGQLVGIVGPNGCGKSNVIDSVRWVLGESSAKQLRGESMQDIIFNGSITRKAVSRASVELVFDNTQKILSNAWNAYSEISIKRILTRSGESSYFINNQNVRKKDITELFLGTGVGSKGYAVIEQGMISRIIDARPEDLRMYLEEAAGVSKYREKRKETLSRLQYTKENLVRLDDIKAQLEESIEHLSSQAKSAKEYQGLKASLLHFQLTQLVLKIDKARASLSEVNQNIGDLRKKLANISSGSEQIQEEFNDLYQKKAIEERQLQLLDEEFNQLRLNITRLDERKKHNEQTNQKMLNEKEHLVSQLPQIKTQIEVLNGALNETKTLLNDNQKTIVAKDSELELITRDFANIDSDYKVSNIKVTELSNKLQATKHSIDLLNNTLSHKQNQSQNLQMRLNGLDNKVITTDNSYLVIKEEITKLSEDINELSTKLDSKKYQKQNLEQQKTSEQNAINELKRHISGLSSKITTIDELIKRSMKVEKLDEILKIPGSQLFSMISVNKGYEIAVEVAIGNILSAIKLDSLDSLLKLPETKLALWFGKGIKDIKINSQSLASVVKSKEDSALISILNEYMIARDYKEALELIKNGHNKIVTLDGHFLTDKYVIFNANLGSSQVLERQQELKSLNQELDKLSKSLDSLVDTHSKLLDNIANTELDIKENTEELSNLNIRVHGLQVEYSRQEQIYLNNELQIKKTNQEKEDLKKEIIKLNEEINLQETQIGTHTKLLESISEEYAVSKLAHLTLENSYKELKTRIDDINLHLKQLNSERKLLDQRLNSSTVLIVEKESSISGVTNRIESLDKEIESLKQNDETAEIKSLQEKINLVLENIQHQKTVAQGIVDKINQMKQSQNRQNSEKSSLEGKLNALILKEQEYRLSIQNLEANIVELEVGEYSTNDLLEENKLNLVQIDDEIKKLRLQIEALGLVNLKAIEDLEESQQKYDNLVMQLDDLRDAGAVLESAIGQIDTESRKLLNDTYARVSQSFDHYFKILFGGGNARLELTEPDILVAGLQIFAEPLGKKNTSLHLLSGGEKALTAMSLVFALFSLNPAPFCLLDEVDAPLDDANTSRFCNLVKELSNNTQFIYISHNRLTMEIANQLVGVTMQEKGISTTVSVNLVDATQNAS